MARDSIDMNVLLLTDDMLPGGVPRHIVDLANGLHKRGLRVTVAATDGPFRRRLQEQIGVVSLPLLSDNSYSKQYRGLPVALAILVRLLLSDKFDLIHTHKRYSDMIGRTLARTFRIPHISTCHNTFQRGLLRSPFGDVTIAVSDAIWNMLIGPFGKNPSRVVRINNQINSLALYDTEHCNVIKKQFSLDSTRTVIVSVGQFIPAKDRTSLIEALAILNNRKPIVGSVACVLVGHGEEEESLRTLADRRGLASVVRFLPGSSDIEAVLNMADFCVLSSVQDGGVPYVLLEAASLSKPHVATNVGGIPEFVKDHETGILVPPRSPVALAQAIEFMLDHPSEMRTLGIQARRAFKARQKLDDFLPRTIAAYTMAIHSKRRSNRI